jgi:hypothetical protein
MISTHRSLKPDGRPACRRYPTIEQRRCVGLESPCDVVSARPMIKTQKPVAGSLSETQVGHPFRGRRNPHHLPALDCCAATPVRPWAPAESPAGCHHRKTRVKITTHFAMPHL